MKIIVALYFVVFHTVLFSQATVNGKISAGDSIQISITSVTPIDFPQIEVLFRAENLNKYPYWGLEKEDLKVFENDQMCNIINLRHFSESEPINISIVVDHSGSMAGSYVDYLDFYDNDTTKMLEAWYIGDVPEITSPLENAVSAVKGFLENFDHTKDKIGLYAFDDTVSIQIEPTQDMVSLAPILDSLEPGGSTSFYDAVYLALESLTSLEGINVVIALTDGQDNSSKKSSTDVISLAKENEVPVYCVGLGDAMADTLQIIADSTYGYYAYTKKSSALDSIYNLLNKKILAYYLMTYESPNWSSIDVDRELTIKFDQSDNYVENNALKFELPEEVVTYLAEREEQERREFQYLVGGIAGGGTVLLIGLTAFILRRRKKKLEILRLYPNPGNGNITLEIELGSNQTADLMVTKPNGTVMYNETCSKSGSISLDLTHLNRGNYLVFLLTKSEKSPSKKYVKL